jgi:ketosteroid isomerase-like protein
MSQENVEIVRRARERGPGDAEFFSPDVVYRPIAIWADSQECRGLDELRRFHENIAEMFAGLRVDNESYHDYGDAVSVRVEFSGAARASGVPIAGKVFVVYWLRDDVIVRVEDYTERVEVVKAVGLEE